MFNITLFTISRVAYPTDHQLTYVRPDNVHVIILNNRDRYATLYALM